jgi:hypothetical protein
MSILNTLLGDTTVDTGNTQAGAAVATNPELGLQLSDVLQAGSSDSGAGFSGIGDLGLGLSAPTLVGVGASNDGISASATDSHGGGGLLGGLL